MYNLSKSTSKEDTDTKAFSRLKKGTWPCRPHILFRGKTPIKFPGKISIQFPGQISIQFPGKISIQFPGNISI
jgi:sorbitol-specific phosphotransferase system component IIA